MALTDIIKSGVDIAFNSLGDLTQVLTLKSIVKKSDPNTLRTEETVTSLPFDGAVLSYQPKEIDNVHILKTDKKVLAKGGENGDTNSLISPPTYNDYVVINSVDHKIVTIKALPGNKLYILQVRNL